MKKLVFFVLLLIPAFLSAQNMAPSHISVSYLGEMLTHPGVKVGVGFTLKDWEKEKTTRKEKLKRSYSRLELSPQTGGFFHRGYQHTFFILPELSITRVKNEKTFFSYGIGAGYLRSILPNTYEQSEAGSWDKVSAGDNHLLTSAFASFGRKVNLGTDQPTYLFVKPQMLYAFPSYTGGVLYFALEAGLRLDIQ